jgi:hypothetical protein
MNVGCFESIGFVEYFIRNIVSHAFVQALLLATSVEGSEIPLTQQQEPNLLKRPN